MNAHLNCPSTHASVLAPSLDAPTLAFDGVENGVIDDTIIGALNGTPGVPFLVPFYANAAVGDSIIMLANGRTAGYIVVKAGPEYDLRQPFTVYIPLTLFQFTGKLDLYYYQEDVNTHTNHAMSNHTVLKVQRSEFPGPYDGGEETLFAPSVAPATYNQCTFDDHRNVTIQVSYPAMAQGDRLQVAIEMRATTLDRRSDFYYLDPSSPAQDVSISDSSVKAIQFTLPPSSFQGVDECICRVYYTVYPSDKPWLQMRSLSTPFHVDVVPPFA